MKQSNEALLRNASWLKSFGATQQKEIISQLIIKDFDPGMTVASKGKSVDHWIGVLEGLVKINSVSVEGKSVTFTGVPPGGWLGEGSMLKNEPRRYDVVAIRASRIAYMPRKVFQQLLDTSISFNRFLLLQLNERLGQFIATVEYHRLLGPDARVARSIAELYNPVLYPDNAALLQISQEELGYLSGISRQRVNQALSRLADQGMVEKTYGGIRVLDLAGLRTHSG
jgi:CRP/FNR family transcriptional regulator, cyclic AMP receptor protein